MDRRRPKGSTRHDLAAQAAYAIIMLYEDDDPSLLIETYERRLDACSAKVEERVQDLTKTVEPNVRRAAVVDIALLTHAIAVLRFDLAEIRKMGAASG